MHQVEQRRSPEFDRHSFIVESNAIDPQYLGDDELIPGRKPGDLLYDNTERALDCFPELAAERPFSSELFHRIHREILAGMPELEEEGIVGRYRKVGVTIGRFIKLPSPRLAKKVIEKKLLPAIEQKRDERLSPADAESFTWWCHDLYECAHPYADGNGRSGRILLNFLRDQYGLPGIVVHYDKRFEYYARLQEFRHNQLGEILSELGSSAKVIRDLCSREAIEERRLKYMADFYVRLQEHLDQWESHEKEG